MFFGQDTKRKKPQISLRLLERKTRLELATPTLARLCSTNRATSAFLFCDCKGSNIYQTSKIFLQIFEKISTFFSFCHFFALFNRKNSLNYRFKLSQESYIVLKIVAQIFNLPLEHCNSLHTHSECKA